MSLAGHEVFKRWPGLHLNDVPEGLVIHGGEGGSATLLNPVAGVVFLLCDGGHDGRAIAAIVAEQFGLASDPLSDVLACLARLEADRLITRVE